MIFFLTHQRDGQSIIHTYPIFENEDPSEWSNTDGLPAGLGDLPLHLDKDGWYSVLGTWNGACNNPNSANQISQGNPENNHAIPSPTMDPPRNDCPSLRRIFCQYHKCSGNRLLVSLTHHYRSTYRITLTCTHTPTVALILAPQADLPARLRIVLGLEPSRQSKLLIGTTEYCIIGTVWIVRLKGVYESELKASSGPIILLLTCGISMAFLMLGCHLGIRMTVLGSLCWWGFCHLLSLPDGIVLLL